MAHHLNYLDPQKLTPSTCMFFLGQSSALFPFLMIYPCRNIERFQKSMNAISYGHRAMFSLQLIQVGSELKRSFAGKASNLVDSCGKSVASLVALITRNFPGTT